MAVVAPTRRELSIAAGGQRFYVRMAAACLAVAVIGFAPTYWIPLLSGRLAVSPITHLHALFFYGWLALLFMQTSLVAAGRLTRHREMGVLGVAIATGMCFVGLGVAINSLKSAMADGFEGAARAFAVVPVSAIALFAVLFAIAIAKTKKPDVHKRLILVATISLLQAAVGRVFFFFLAPPTAEGVVGSLGPPPVSVTVVPGLVADLLIVAAMIRDLRTIGRVHPTYWISGAVVLAVQVLRVPLGTTSAWTQITTWLLALAP
jgi:hypothetical protein